MWSQLTQLSYKLPANFQIVKRLKLGLFHEHTHTHTHTHTQGGKKNERKFYTQSQNESIQSFLENVYKETNTNTEMMQIFEAMCVRLTQTIQINYLCNTFSTELKYNEIKT
jgi:hypothetical protein